MIQGLYYTCVCFGVLVGLFYVAEAADKCAIPAATKGAKVPKHKLITFDILNDVTIGPTGTSRRLYEVTNLQDNTLPALRKVSIYWHLLPDGMYTNTGSGYYELYQQCFNFPVNLFPLKGEFKGINSLGFTFLDVISNGTTSTNVEMIGTQISSCPDRYIINWYCPWDQYIRGGKYRCHEGIKMNIMTFDPRPDHVPWHLIAGDLCENKLPPMDDPRWLWTWENTQCNITTTPQSSRKKRSEDNDYQTTLWP